MTPFPCVVTWQIFARVDIGNYNPFVLAVNHQPIADLRFIAIQVSHFRRLTRFKHQVTTMHHAAYAGLARREYLTVLRSIDAVAA